MPCSHPLPIRDRRGAVAIIVVLALVALLGAAALVVDLGYATASKQELQAGADAGAHAGAVFLDGTADGLDVARAAAVDGAAFNEADNSPVVLDPSADVTLGRWRISTGTFDPSESDPRLINAVQVVTGRDDLPAWFSHAVFGRTALSAGVESIAYHSTSGAGEVQCVIPIAIPSCVLYKPGTTTFKPDLGEEDFVLNPPGINNIGWAMLGGGTPSADYLVDMMGNCTLGGAVTVSDIVGLNNGEITSALMYLAEQVEASTTRWEDHTYPGTEELVFGDLPVQDTFSPYSGIDADKWGNTFEAPIAVIENDEYCDSPSHPFLGDWPIVGFVWGAVYDVVYTGPVDKTIRMRFDLANPHNLGTDDGGINFGIEYVKIALVK
ncbi:MAG: hypothetical protein JXB39_09930 [Deltaproteobacteria bacterium]|nr:hypothetical protein [Deltaproteobacteria bacterium]